MSLRATPAQAVKFALLSPVLAAIATICVISLQFVATDGLRVLGYDPFSYVTLSYQVRSSFPTHLGIEFPYGYPLLGAALSPLFSNHYKALLFVNYLAVFGVAWLAIASTNNPVTKLTLAALIASSSVFVIGAASPGTGASFSMLLLAFAATLPRWKDSKALIALSVGIAVLSITIRYAGGFLLPLCFCWALYLHVSGQQFPKRFAVLAIFLGCALAASLLLTNIHATGHFSGIPRPAAHAHEALSHAANLGLSVVSIASSRLAVTISDIPALNLLVGLSILCTLLSLCVAGLNFRAGLLINSLSIVSIGYLISLIIFRSISQFDDLHSLRFFGPVFIPIAIILLSLAPTRKIGFALCAGVIVVGMVKAPLGSWGQTFADVRPAVPIVASKLSQGHVVAVNRHGQSLLAYVDSPVERKLVPEFSNLKRGDVFVFVAQKTPASDAVFDDEWSKALKEQVRRGKFSMDQPVDNIRIYELKRSPAR